MKVPEGLCGFQNPASCLYPVDRGLSQRTHLDPLKQSVRGTAARKPQLPFMLPFSQSKCSSNPTSFLYLTLRQSQRRLPEKTTQQDQENKSRNGTCECVNKCAPQWLNVSVCLVFFAVEFFFLIFRKTWVFSVRLTMLDYDWTKVTQKEPRTEHATVKSLSCYPWRNRSKIHRMFKSVCYLGVSSGITSDKV